MLEQESWGLLTKAQFDDFLDRFSKQFGSPVRSRRLSISFWDHSRNSVDTRIRITDGKPQIMQKVGTWEGTRAWSRTGQHLPLTPTLSDVYQAYRILRVLIPDRDACYMAQYENYLFRLDGYGIKLTHQTGKTDKYNFEVEITTENIRLHDVLKDLQLTDLVTVTDAEFWHTWNKELNLSDEDLTEQELQVLIQQYLHI